MIRRCGRAAGAYAPHVAPSSTFPLAHRPAVTPVPAAPGRQDYSCFDFRLRSDIPLTELEIADETADRRPIVTVRLAAIPAILAGSNEALDGLQVADDTALLEVRNTARYLVRAGTEIFVDPLPGASARNVRLFLLGSALGILCHQRGSLPLHANAVVSGGKAFAFSGPSGTGKSTLSAYFASTGRDVLSDDVCVVSLNAAGGALAWPGLSRLKLWGDAAARFGYESERLEPVVDAMDKYQIALPARNSTKAIPLRKLYLLSRAGPDDALAPRRLRGREAVEAIMANTYRASYLHAMGLAGRHFLQSSALANRIEVYAAPRLWGYDVLAAEAERLASYFSGDPAPRSPD